MPIYIFHRKSGFEPVNTPNSESQVIKHGSTDPTVLKIEFAPTGRIVWERPEPEMTITKSRRICPECKNETVIDDGYCIGICRQSTLPPIQTYLPKFKVGDSVRKIKGSQWKGRIVGAYSTELTKEGYCVESDSHAGSVQIYPASALEIL